MGPLYAEKQQYDKERTACHGVRVDRAGQSVQIFFVRAASGKFLCFSLELSLEN